LDLSAEERAAKASAHCLKEFCIACRKYLPGITVEVDLDAALLFVAGLLRSESKAQAA
jgi:hypothetical protein